jgi:lysophospholipase L1-like esterase
VDLSAGIFRLPAGSRIPVKTLAEMYPPATSKLPKISHKRGDAGTCLIWSEGHFFHDLQVEVTYTHAHGLWKGPVPAFAGEAIPRTFRKLRNREPLKLFLVGDSISQGYNASGLTKAAPNMPCYGQLVALGLERAYETKVEFQNCAVAGWRIENGLGAIAKPIAGKPDLVIVAFGMNDSGKSPAQYADGIRQIQAKIREGVPEVEFVLVGSMTPNPEWSATQLEKFPLFRDELAKLCGPGVALADLTGVWTELLKRKGYHDLTGNGVNHPNDFGHRLYAQVILGLLTDPRRKE